MLLQQLEISPLRSTKHACVYLEILQIDECMTQQLLFINLHSPAVNLKTRYLRKQNTEHKEKLLTTIKWTNLCGTNDQHWRQLV